MMRMIVRPTYSIINYGLHVVGAGEKKIKYKFLLQKKMGRNKIVPDLKFIFQFQIFNSFSSEDE
jgi:hypothetical protein